MRARYSLRRSAAVFAGCAALVSVLASAGPASADSLGGVHTLPQSGSFTVYVRGNGHGHGLSQYGAEGAAAKGLSTSDILAFYYPGTQRTVLPASRIRVKLSGAAAYTTVFASTPGLRLCAQAPLPLTGIQYYRLAPSGSGLALQRLRTGASSWETVTSNLPNGTCFASDIYYERVLNSDGSSTRYHGYIRAVRSGSGEFTVDNVSLDNYAAAVTPREIPASWYDNAVHAQAIAARTYGRYAVEHSAGADYDICDSSSCQVYGGMAHFAKDGTQEWTEDPDAIVGNENTVLTYNGSAIFAQFSASDGGAEAYGGFPYLPAKADPYDSYPVQNHQSTARQVASYYGLKQATALEITTRDGIGPWGGRVVSGYVDGATSSGAKVRWATTGFEIGAALGVYTNYFGIDG